MTLERAVEVFVKGFSSTRSFSRPYEATRHGPLWIMRDPPGSKGYQRLTEVVAVNTLVPNALRALKTSGIRRHAFCYLVQTNAPHDKFKHEIKSAGYRLLRREPVFTRLTEAVQPKDCGFEIRRILTTQDADALNSVTKGKQIRPEHLREDAPHRVLAAFDGSTAVGWVRSSSVGQDAWISNMVVRPEFQRRGIATALMTAILAEDYRHGIEHSVLLATTAGSQLYPRVGYTQIGLLQLFMPTRGK
jgi:GNAT superfamily N-acetyltransferase